MEIRHILADGTLETHADAEMRLMSEEKVPREDLFLNAADLLARAYEARGRKIAYAEANETAAAL
jgi:hypothetical protein